MTVRRWLLGCIGLCGFAGCHTAGSDWMSQPLPGADDPWASSGAGEAWPEGPSPRARKAKTGLARTQAPHVPEGHVLGRFRNTYYDFPSEADYGGQQVSLMDKDCHPIKQVPQGFHDAICVQGSGRLSNGVTVSFSKRDCECARVCPRTGQKICFDALDSEQFPWGRGALGEAITPLLTVAVDDSVIPMHTVLYIPEFEGVPRDASGSAVHDGCFVAQDRGLHVTGPHVDVFTGRQSVTELWNRLVPSNQGVTVILDAPRCAAVGAEAR